ncbi:hypothetical protein N7486_003822 [Penicillium sp. IBT 16267x]|nr:hypothetical protein N7486_003822 [Penicillium sp. IBT 16267x]
MNLFAFGSNGSGQLGLGHTEDVSTPTQCLFTSPFAASAENQDQDPVDQSKDKIVQIVAGGNHTLLLTRQGHVYAAGCNSDGRCGPDTHIDLSNDQLKANSDKIIPNEEEHNILRFQRVILTDATTGCTVGTFKSVSATWEASILVANVSAQTNTPDNHDDHTVHTDKVFVQGSAPKGELGLGEKTLTHGTFVTPGTSIPNFPPLGTTVSALASGMGHSVAILSNGDVYGWGGSRKGQLGEGLKGAKIVWSPMQISGIPFTATGAVCGREFTVVIGRREKGEFLVLGDKGNWWGVMDVKDFDALRVRIRGEEGVGASVDSSCVPSTSFRGGAALWGFEYIGASWHGIYVHMAARAEDGSSSPAAANENSLVAWGRNDRGQLPPPDLPALDRLAVGSEHVLTLLRDGSVAAFGWGEHGNCGPDTDPHGNVAGMYKVISLPDAVYTTGGKVVGVGAGCATSWVIVD